MRKVALVSSFLTISFLMLLSLIFGNSKNFQPPYEIVDGTQPKFQEVQNVTGSLNGIVSLYWKTNNEPFCTGFVINKEYAVTATHCVISNFFNKDKNFIGVKLDGGIDSGVIAKPIGYNLRSDLALIKGDFTKFIPINVDFYNTSYNTQPKLVVSCGYPWLQKKMVCNTIIINGTIEHMLTGLGVMTPGMSGGPVFDAQTKMVIGINRGFTDSSNVVIVAPIQGFLGIFRLE